MVAQIRTGLWVRNGFAIRGQLLHYRDFMLRELCYDQDLYILQTALIILDPDLIFVSTMDRFQLLHFFEGGVAHPSYDSQQLLSMVEEFLYVLITILSEGANASKMPIKDAVRREIVHALAVGPCTFTDLVKRVAERLVEDPCFERVLREVANFRAPEATTDSGMYELKPDAYDEINPFFYHYTRNKREEVETVLHNHWKKRGVQDPVIVPRPLGITSGPFATLAVAFDSEVLLQILFYATLNILVLTEVSGVTPSSGEAILDQTLHLAMLALVERPGTFSHLAATKQFEDGKNFIDMLCVLEHHEQYRAYKARCDWILRAMAQHVPEAVHVRRRVVLPEAGEGPEDAKKRAARARQEAIMRQMREQQASFVSNIEDDDYEDEDIADADEPASLGTCIVCQEELNTSKPFGALGLIQPSKLVRKQPDGNGGLMNDVMTSPYSLDRSPPASENPTFPPRGDALHDPKITTFEVFPSQNIRFGLHSSICSHLMHLDCFNAYTLSIRQRHRTQAARNHPESIPRKEYICPLCKSLGNVILPVLHPAPIQLNTLPFADWTRAAGISILKSKSDPLLDSLLINNGTGELVFWGAQDPSYVSFFRAGDRWPDWVMHKMVDSVMNIARAISQQSRHLRDRPEPDAGDRGAGLYLPEDLVGYTIACLEISQRGVGSPGGTVSDNVTESQARMLRGLITCLGKLAVVPFRGRQDEGREALRQAIIKRLLPEWSLSTLNPVSYPLLLRDPFTIVVETAAVAPEMLRHVLILSYYAFLARTVIGLIYVLNKTRSWPVQQPTQRTYENLFGDLRMFFTSVVRHSPVVEHASEIVFTTYGEARIEKLMYCFTLPFLRRAAILVRAVLPGAFPSPALTNAGNERSEYSRLLSMLGIPPLADLPSQDTLQTSLAGWCSHYGHSHAASQLNCGIVLENPTIYRIARLPTMLDTLFGELDRALTCKRCNTLPPDAAICLICGAAVCFQSHCCTDKEQGDRGECNMHTRE
jgi:E3 ubiquitin-protein ligase UBR1